MKRILIALVVLAFLILPVAPAAFDGEEVTEVKASIEFEFCPWAYDVDGSGYIEIEEALAAIYDYPEEITKAEALQVLNLFYDQASSLIPYVDVIYAIRRDFVEDEFIFFDDSHYKSARLDPIRAVVESDLTDEFKYVANDFDCDDFTWGLMGAFHHNLETAAMPIFAVSVQYEKLGETRYHRMIAFYYNGEMILIEPQSDRFYNVPEDWILRLLIG